ncbi:HEAT repeat domain-containing protein [Niabella sp. CC-SYL272]|uniref:HEAT repeat domain-containing protein n=1 Tax=Niabella agricola TaxID=2891571 RepID=UPI001F1F4EEF|nr:HEAT repeat domain-containing protein [Niabella agricola]MCF3110264.1 HEAT repeat domain-containing protein [Niabella agricola]
MKKDILKEFVSENRDDFDDQEPGSDVLGKIQARLGLEPSVVVPRAKVLRFPYWWAAAAAIIVVIIGSVVFFPQHNTGELPIAKTAEPTSVKPGLPAGKKDSMGTVPLMATAAPVPERKKPVVRKPVRTGTEKNAGAYIGATIEMAASNTTTDDWQKALQSESSSTRLAAVLACGKSSAALSGSDLERLTYTMNNDENSNVRLAALEVLKKQGNPTAVEPLILQSVARQDDPVVQMELLASLSSDEATKIKQQLLAITQNPTNIDAVRNQAYAALLRSESNF